MDLIKGYCQVTYNELQGSLKDAYTNCEKTDVSIASEIGVRSSATVKNALAFDEQKVSDEILTKIFHCIGFVGFVVWQNGKRIYYIKTKK